MLELRVLIVEDSEDDYDLLVRTLERSGSFTVRATRCASARQMRALLLVRPWDIILSDDALPGFSGLEALCELQQSSLDIPFIMVSGTANEERIVEALTAGAHNYRTLRRESLPIHEWR